MGSDYCIATIILSSLKLKSLVEWKLSLTVQEKEQLAVM